MCSSVLILIYLSTLLVPLPDVNVIALSDQTVGQSLTLQCEVTIVRGITSRVDIVWSSDGEMLQMMNNVSSTTMDNSLVYTDSYTISMLNTSFNARTYECRVVINANPPTTTSNNVTLNVNGEYCMHNNMSLLTD